MDPSDQAKSDACNGEIQKALVATLFDLQPRMMQKYQLDSFAMSGTIGYATIAAGLHLILRAANASPEEERELMRHIGFMVSGFIQKDCDSEN